MSLRHVAAGGISGAILATALWAWATPADARYRAYETFAEALSIIERNYARPVQELELLRSAIAGMTAALDPRSAYLAPRRFQKVQEDTEGELADVGLLLGPPRAPALDPRQLAQPAWPEVSAVLPGSPAEAAGISPGDRLLSIDGEPTAAATALTPGDPERWRARLRGSAGTRVRLSLQRPGWRRPKEWVLVRAHRRVLSVSHRVLEEIAVITIERFVESTATEVRRALAQVEAAGAVAVVLDLRANPGGVVDQALAVADLFLEGGTMVTLHERDRKQVRVAHPGGYEGPVVVLVDAGTASAAELVAAALADNHRARLVGESTYGKGSVQTFFPLSDGSALKLTTGWYATAAGNLLESNGIQPHVKVPRNIPTRNVPRMSSSQTPSAGNPNGATIAPGFDDDPQLVAAVALARSSVPGAPNRGRRGAGPGASAGFPDR
ncbi:MAG: PDZ domain-containing protein [Myxococcales bacterium]|nr:PDZ domain-containing protein [Myxococcales bacterium]